jgi:biotin carboxyl carrier protein
VFFGPWSDNVPNLSPSDAIPGSRTALSRLGRGSAFGVIVAGLVALSWPLGSVTLSEPKRDLVAAAPPGSSEAQAQAREISDVVAPVDGRVTLANSVATSCASAFEPGDRVHRGQVLAVIRSAELGEKGRSPERTELELHAPCDGVLLEVVAEGSSVQSGTVVFRISGRPTAMSARSWEPARKMLGSFE